MLGIGCPGRHALPLTPPQHARIRHARSNPARPGSFLGAKPMSDAESGRASPEPTSDQCIEARNRLRGFGLRAEMQGAARRLHAIGSDNLSSTPPNTNREPNRFDAVGGSANFCALARIPFQRRPFGSRPAYRRLSVELHVHDSRQGEEAPPKSRAETETIADFPISASHGRRGLSGHSAKPPLPSQSRVREYQSATRYDIGIAPWRIGTTARRENTLSLPRQRKTVRPVSGIGNHRAAAGGRACRHRFDPGPAGLTPAC
jgi:hypothetical protein